MPTLNWPTKESTATDGMMEPELEAAGLRQQMLELAYRDQKLKTVNKEMGWALQILLALNLLQFLLR
jgi:hypothetical protein